MILDRIASRTADTNLSRRNFLAPLEESTRIPPGQTGLQALPDMLARPASQSRIKALMARGFHRAGDVENRLGFYVGQIGR